MDSIWFAVGRAGLEEAARWVARREGRENLYLLLNPVDPGLKKRGRARARNEDVASSRAILIDVDPEKVKQRDVDLGAAAPEDLDPEGTRPEKLAAAAELALEIRALLEERLGVRAPLVSSGRGRQLWLRVAGGELDPDERRRLVYGLRQRFDRPGVASLDKSTHNAARLARLPGARNLRTGERAEVLDAGDGRAADAAAVRALLEELSPPRPQARERAPGRFRHAALHGARPDGELDPERVRSALEATPTEGDYERWYQIGMALKASDLPDGVAFGLWDDWSSTGESYPGSEALRFKWKSFKGSGVSPGTIFHHAIQAGWAPPPRELPPAAARRLPAARLEAPPRETVSPAEAIRIVRETLRAPRPRGGAGPVVQDRRPTGAGKTTTAARELVVAAAERVGRFAWASPSHDHGRLEALPALAAAGAAVWDLDLDGPEGAPPEAGVRARLEREGALVLPLGEPAPGSPETPIAVKYEPFDCPGPAVPGWTREKVGQLYDAAAARGWNPTATVCRACPRFLAHTQPDADADASPCPYWERRRIAAQADVLVVPHHSLRPSSGATDGRRALVIDEDPSGALVKTLRVTKRSVRAFLRLLEVASERALAEPEALREELEDLEAERAQQELLWAEPKPYWPEPEEVLRRSRLAGRIERREVRAEEVVAQAELAERALAVALDLVERLEDLPREELAVAYELTAPLGLEAAELEGLEALGRACELTLRELAKRDERLLGPDGRPVGVVRNLLPLLRRLGASWGSGAAAVLHCHRPAKRGRQPKGGERELAELELALPVVEPLPPLSILALDATGDPRLLELATGRAVELVEGTPTAELAGLHLADVPCGRRRWDPRRARPKESGGSKRGRGGAEALEADLGVISRYARRVGAKRIGLVTFQRDVERFRAGIEAAGLEVRSLYYGGEVGRNDFERWADLVVVAGTPYVPPHAVRLRAALEGAGLEELLARPEWTRRRLPGGGTASQLGFPGEATARAYRALVRARLEQSLGRAQRWDWVPRCGALVLAEPWPTRHRLKVSTRTREALVGPAADALELLREAYPEPEAGAAPDTASGDPIDWVRARVADLVAGSGAGNGIDGISRRTVRRWLSGASIPEQERIRQLLDWRASATNPEHRSDDSGNVRTPPLNCTYLRGRVRTSGIGATTPVGEADHLAADDSGTIAAKWRSPVDVSSWSIRRLARAARIVSGTWAGLAEELGVAERTIALWRDGTRSPSPRSRRRLEEAARAAIDVAAGLGLPELASRLAGGDAALAEATELDARAVGRWRAGADVPPEALERIRGYVRDAQAEVFGLEELPPGSSLPGVGRTYAPARRPSADLSPAPPAALSEAEEIARGLEELRAWASASGAPGWLSRAAREAKGLGSLVRWLGLRSRAEPADVDLALERAQTAQEDLSQPIYARRLWGRVVQTLVKRGATPRGRFAVKVKPGGKLARARAAAAGRAGCRACGGSGKSSSGGPCYPCQRAGREELLGRRAALEPAARASVAQEPLVKEAARELKARAVGRVGK